MIHSLRAQVVTISRFTANPRIQVSLPGIEPGTLCD